MLNPKASRSKQVPLKKPKAIVLDAAWKQKLFRRGLEFMRTKSQGQTYRETLAPVNRSLDSQKAERSGQFLPGIKLIPLDDLAARWKVSPAMVREAANTGLFKIVVVQSQGMLDHWYLDQSLWPHGGKRFTVPAHGIIHTLIDPSIPGLLFPPTLPLFFPIEEVTRVEEEKKLHTADKFIGQKEAADLADVGQRTIRNWDKAGILTSTKQTPSGRPRYKYDEVLKLRKKHT